MSWFNSYTHINAVKSETLVTYWSQLLTREARASGWNVFSSIHVTCVSIFLLLWDLMAVGIHNVALLPPSGYSLGIYSSWHHIQQLCPSSWRKWRECKSGPMRMTYGLAPHSSVRVYLKFIKIKIVQIAFCACPQCINTSAGSTVTEQSFILLQRKALCEVSTGDSKRVECELVYQMFFIPPLEANFYGLKVSEAWVEYRAFE